MSRRRIGVSRFLSSAGWCALACVCVANAQQVPNRPREFRPGVVNLLEDLPASRLRTRIEGLPEAARTRALERLRRFHFTEDDLASLDVDPQGGIFYADTFAQGPGPNRAAAAPVAAESEPVVAEAPVPVSPFPGTLIFHSKRGAPNVLFLNFSGDDIAGTGWNVSLSRALIPAAAFSTDSDSSTFSDAEQLAIKRIWQRVAEDYAPFEIDVTTERPTVMGNRVAHALITRNTDENGDLNPSSSAGGVAYVDAFGEVNYSYYRPAWIYANNVANSEANIAEAASHEIGHNLGLSHDGATGGQDYYGGHGSGDTSWGPLMGTGYNRSVTQWSMGEYYHANNSQDDLAEIAARISYRTDDRGNTVQQSTALVITGGTNIVSTTPESDPANTNPANKGILERNTDVDVFSFTTGTGPVDISVNPFRMTTGTRGGNVDLVVELRQASGSIITTNNPATDTTARIQTSLTQGTYYLYVRSTGVGTPLSATPSGYTSYGSLGQYFISGFVARTQEAAPVQVTATVNNPSWGAVNPTSATYPPGSTAQVLATPATYYAFTRWTNGAATTNNPLSLLVNTNVLVQALFAELMTTNYPTPHWWLASHGYASNFETAVSMIGANRMPLWQSYIAGLNPNDPNSRLDLSARRGSGSSVVLDWNSVTGRVYSILRSTNLSGPYTALSGASDLPPTTRSFTNTVSPNTSSAFYQLQVRKP